MLTSRTPVKGARREHRFFDDSTTALTGFAVPMKDLKAKQRTVMFILIDQATGIIRQARNIKQRMCQLIQLLITKLRRFMLPGQPNLPKDLYPQVVT